MRQIEPYILIISMIQVRQCLCFDQNSNINVIKFLKFLSLLVVIPVGYVVSIFSSKSEGHPSMLLLMCIHFVYRTSGERVEDSASYRLFCLKVTDSSRA